MKLEYNILWIDNDIQDYIDNQEINKIKLFLEDLGFEPSIITVEDEGDLDNYLYIHKYDLIISDFNLNSTTGDIIIQKIRNEKGFSTEILFYTAKSNFMNDPDVKDRIAFTDRITFHSNRDTFLEKAEKVIMLTLDKLLELNATRGLVTAATSDLDVEIENLVIILIEKTKIEEAELKKYITDCVVNPMRKRLESFWDKYEGFQEYLYKIDAIRKWEILRILLKKINSNDDIRQFLAINKNYQNDVIEVRNKFAHARAEETDGKVSLKGRLGKDDFEFDQEACIKIRRDLIVHKNSFKNLKAIIDQM